MEDKEHRPSQKESSSFHRQASEVLGEEFWQDMAVLLPKPGPRVDLYHTHTAVTVLAELPGLASAEQIGLSLDGQTLVLEGEIPCDYPVTQNRIALQERFFGSFRRSIPLPKPVTLKNSKARYSRGLLIVELQIEPAAPQTQIPVDFG
ncbi:hypothetical protein J31TS4_14500 [Paenibacillus sp. J31TS4]|uniref:Hsp20/alpha crystallin family protein n=1 Tax=Paenibacillus sp. J31TS4 TaxID=2807195 RepID=UPI001B2C8FA9|nr:Hsp20/alpha crystallin family protein [Paenibacillus sp. J31TS4]GIP38170.1 hypothetical protein J31TS4_14500 [Paenibacillus sp. J31TS4]